MQLSILPDAEAPESSQPLLAGIRADLGIVPNLAATAAHSPALLAGFDGLRRAVASTTVDPVLREVAGVAVGVAVDNRYGVAFHSTVLLGLGVAAAEVDRMRSGEAPSAPDAAAVYRFAREVVLGRGKVDPTTVASVAASGVGEQAILELLLEVNFAAMVGVIDNFAGPVELDGFLAPQRWQR